MAQIYQRKVDEFNVLLGEYSRESANIEQKMRAFQVEISSETAFSSLEQSKAEMYQQQIDMAKERVKYL